jgi:hypothetical protein
MESLGRIAPRDTNSRLQSHVIASEAKQSISPRKGRMDCFAALAMMVWTASLKRHLVPKRGRRSATEGSRP